jgi:hypothetical protein
MESMQANEFRPKRGKNMLVFSSPLTDLDRRALFQFERAMYDQGRVDAAVATGDRLKESMRGLLLEFGRDRDWTREEMDALLDHLGLERTKRVYNVEVRFGEAESLLVAGVEANSEDEAGQIVVDNIEISAHVQADVSVEYSGPGQLVPEEEIEFEYDDSIEEYVVDAVQDNIEVEATESEDVRW